MEVLLHPLHPTQPHNPPSSIRNFAHAYSSTYNRGRPIWSLGLEWIHHPFPCWMRDESPCITLMVSAVRGGMSRVSPRRLG
ncbi:hypothetical protein NQZ68_012011 [Dissostichus eleginoides]|nr:hypothetical protein NQZ68_012011 [Dissostichus eleginoides]